MIKLNSKFKPIRSKNSPRYVLLTGGRGSSKSFGVATIMADRVCSPGHSILYTRYTMASASLSIIPELEEKLQLLEVSESFSVTNTAITNKQNDSNIIFKGIKTSSGNQTANLKSLQGITTWVLDEADELESEGDFDKIDMSVRTTTQKNQIVLIMNPTTTEHWIWGRWFENSHRMVQIDGCDVAMSTHPDVLHIHFTYLDNLEYLDDHLINLWRRMKVENPDKYAHRIIGGWLNAKEGVIYENWEEGDFNFLLPSALGLDYGFEDPLGIIEVAVDRKKKRIYMREIGYDSHVTDVVDYLRKKKVDKKKMIIADLNEPKTTIAIREAGYNIKKAKKAMIKDDIRNISDYKFIVDPSSHNLKKELRNYVWNDKKSEVPIDAYNHLLDPLRYAFNKLAGRRGRGVRTKNRR